MPCVAGLAHRQDDTPGTGCRHDCLHRAKVLGYRDLKATEAEVRKLSREAATAGARTDGSEGREWDAANPELTFQQYLLDTAQRANTEEDTAA